VLVDTVGDRRVDVPLAAIGGQGVFVKEVQAAVLDGRADLAVHSAKDLPSTSTPGLVLAAFGARADPRDALVGATLDQLGRGAVIGTGSVRRRAQLAHLRPDLTFAELRGNIGTRLARAGEYDAIVMAAAALRRLDLAAIIAQLLEPDVVLPQVGQGAIAVEARAGDEAVLAAAAAFDDGPTRRAVEAERAFLAVLGGGCSLPVGAFATLGADATISLSALVAAEDGSVVVRASAAGDDPVPLGREVAARVLAAGGAALLAGRGGPPGGPPGGLP